MLKPLLTELKLGTVYGICELKAIKMSTMNVINELTVVSCIVNVL